MNNIKNARNIRKIKNHKPRNKTLEHKTKIKKHNQNEKSKQIKNLKHTHLKM